MILRLAWTALLLLGMNSVLPGQPFPCDGEMLLSFNSGGNVQQMRKIHLGSFGTVFYNNLDPFRGAQFNGLGFNPVDNYIYAVKDGSNEIVRLKSDGTFDVIGNIPIVDNLSVTAGDCTAQGHYLCIDNELDQLLIFKVVDGLSLIGTYDLTYTDESGSAQSFGARLEDIAVDPNDPNVAYGYQGDYFHPDLLPDAFRGYVHKININPEDEGVGSVVPVVRIPSDQVRRIGSLMYSKNGVLHGYGTESQGVSPTQKKFFSINMNSGDITELIGPGPLASSSDGCSCPYALTFTSDVRPRDVKCTDSEVSFVINITNRYFIGFDGLSVIDTIPEGMVIESITGNFNGQIEPGSGVGKEYLTISNINVPPKANIEIEIKAKIIEIDVGFSENQALLENLPELLGGNMFSDDPQTPDFTGDKSEFMSLAPSLNDVTIDITHPSDCFSNDGKALIRSPVFIPEEEYFVRLRDEDYNEIRRNTVANANNTFNLDTLPPGEYELFQIVPKTASCGFSMKDTTISVMPPHETITASATSNSPLCQGSALSLSGTMSPEGSISWKGPRDFKSKEEIITFYPVDTIHGGKYIMKAKYGECEQNIELDVLVSPEMDAEIESEVLYCQREDMELVALGNGPIESFSWSGPNGLVADDSIVSILSLGPEDGGTYELILNNGFCQDTVRKDIVVAPAPTIKMNDFIVSDFCNSVILDPEILDESDVSYQWYPNIGLDCADCPQPEVIEPLSDGYRLKVESPNGCRDSAYVDVVLSPDALFYAPNVFSPNADSENDYFRITSGCGVREITRLTIVDRWGNTIYVNGPITPGDQSKFWDGTYDSQKAKTGVYLWFLELELINGDRRLFSGDVTLVR